MLAHQIPEHLQWVGQNDCQDCCLESKVQPLGHFVAILVNSDDFAQDSCICDRGPLAVVLRVQTDQLVSQLRRLINTIRSVVSKEVRVLAIATVAEAGVGPDLPIRLSQAHGENLEVKDVALALLVVAQCARPRLQRSLV